jgi:hypothetical protein
MLKTEMRKLMHEDLEKVQARSKRLAEKRKNEIMTKEI